MSLLRVGCVGFRGPLARYFKQLTVKELTEQDRATGLRQLGRWQREAPEGANFVARVSPDLVAAEFAGPAADAAWAETCERAAKVGADTVLLRTGSSFRPSAERKAAMIAFFKNVEGPRVAWWAEGLWEGSEALAEVCEACGMTPVVDPLAMDDDEQLPPGDFVYWRLMGRRGLQGRLSDYDLDTLLDTLGERHGYVIFTAPTMLKDAQQFAMLAGAAPNA